MRANVGSEVASEVLSLLVALGVHAPRPRRFVLEALAAALYIGGGFMATFLVNVTTPLLKVT